MLNELIDTENYRIEITGAEGELENFLYCLDECLTKGILKFEIEDLYKSKNKYEQGYNQLNLTSVHRIYLMDSSKLLFLPNSSDAKTFFPLIKESYFSAKNLYDKKFKS
ncbi:MAG: hypothetical protein ACLFN8_00860 [Candidatus Woesearchaeota archaeon]